jgi:hypothetical protein
VGETGLVGKAMAGRVVRMLRSPGVSSLSSLVNDLGSINCCEGKQMAVEKVSRISNS